MTTERIGFIGLGNMGGRMARRMTGAGFRVLGYDPGSESIEAAGAEAAASRGRPARAPTDVVLLSLPDSKVVEAVLYGEGGAIDAAA